MLVGDCAYPPSQNREERNTAANEARSVIRSPHRGKATVGQELRTFYHRNLFSNFTAQRTVQARFLSPIPIRCHSIALGVAQKDKNYLPRGRTPFQLANGPRNDRLPLLTQPLNSKPNNISRTQINGRLLSKPNSRRRPCRDNISRMQAHEPA